MRNEQQFYVCKHCGNLVGMVKNAGVKMICCGEPMTRLEPNTTDAATEKHVPVVSINGDVVTVDVGSVPHPMQPEHFIEWIYMETEKGGQRKVLNPGDIPQVKFTLMEDKAVAVFAYCNLHGLWKVEV